MGKQVAKKYGYTAASVFFKIGNSFNLSNVIKPNDMSFVSDQQEALTEDWDAVSREVKVALGKFREVYGEKD